MNKNIDICTNCTKHYFSKYRHMYKLYKKYRHGYKLKKNKIDLRVNI